MPRSPLRRSTCHPRRQRHGGHGGAGLAADPNSQYYASNTQTSATVNLDNSSYPLANWQFDAGSGSTAANSGTGASLTGTLINSPTWSSGETGDGLTFNGSNYVDVPYNSTMASELSFGTGGFTLSAWVKLNAGDNFTNVTYPIFSIGGSSTSQITLTLANNGNYEWTLGLYLNISGTNEWSWLCPMPDTSNIFRDHQWHMVTLTRSANDVGMLYLDGSPLMINLGGGQGTVKSLNMSTTVYNLQNGTNDLYIGYSQGSYFKGSINDVEVYNVGLTQSQVRALADEQLADPATASATPVSTSQISVNWTCNGQDQTGFYVQRARPIHSSRKTSRRSRSAPASAPTRTPACRTARSTTIASRRSTPTRPTTSRRQPAPAAPPPI